MVSIEDDAVPDAENLVSSDPLHGTMWEGDYETVDPSGSDSDWEYEDPTNDPNSPEYEDPELDFGDDSPPEDSGGSDPIQDVDPAPGGDDSGLLAAPGVGAAGLFVGLIVAGVAVLGGD